MYYSTYKERNKQLKQQQLAWLLEEKPEWDEYQAQPHPNVHPSWTGRSRGYHGRGCGIMP